MCDRDERLEQAQARIRELEGALYERVPDSMREQARQFEDLARSERTKEAANAMLWCAKQVKIEARAITPPDSEPAEQQDAMLERREALPAWIRHRLNGAVRQYRHNNDNSPSLSNPEKGFVFAYDCGAVETLIHRILHALSRTSDEGGVPEAVNVVFDGPPGPTPGRFVEVETDDGKSVRVGEWIERDDGLWALRIDRAIAEQGGQRVPEAVLALPKKMAQAADYERQQGDYVSQAVWQEAMHLTCRAIEEAEAADPQPEYGESDE